MEFINNCAASISAGWIVVTGRLEKKRAAKTSARRYVTKLLTFERLAGVHTSATGLHPYPERSGPGHLCLDEQNVFADALGGT
jgi:hypothetical protein